jgi:Zn ribbon nucleic-acid-binding protein
MSLPKHNLIGGYCPTCNGSCLVGFDRTNRGEGDCTRCGHGKRSHHKPTRRDPTHCYMLTGERRMVHHVVGKIEYDLEQQDACPCEGFTVAVLPEGERLEFGKHRLPQDEAETAPAWPPLP